MNIQMIRTSPARHLIVSSLLAVAFSLTASAKPGWVDKPLAVDPEEKATPCDWLEFYASPGKDGLKLAYRCAIPINFSLGAAYSVYLDTDGRRDTGFRGSDDQFPIGADYLLQGATLFQYTGNTGERSGLDWAWNSLGMVTFNVSRDWADFVLTKEQLPVPAGVVNVMLMGDNEAANVGGNFNDVFPDQALINTGTGRSIQIRYEDAKH